MPEPSNYRDRVRSGFAGAADAAPPDPAAGAPPADVTPSEPEHTGSA